MKLKSWNPCFRSKLTILFFNSDYQLHAPACERRLQLFTFETKIKMNVNKRSHYKTPVLLAAVEFVMKTFEWRPPKILFSSKK